MNHIENFIKAVEQRLPAKDLISSKDLVKAGIVSNVNTLARWRTFGQGPKFIKISKGQVKYLRPAVLEWLRKRTEGEHVNNIN